MMSDVVSAKILKVLEALLVVRLLLLRVNSVALHQVQDVAGRGRGEHCRLRMVVGKHCRLGYSRWGGCRLHGVSHEVLLAPEMGMRLLLLLLKVENLIVLLLLIGRGPVGPRRRLG